MDDDAEGLDMGGGKPDAGVMEGCGGQVLFCGRGGGKE